MKGKNILTGLAGEKLAASYLEKNGFRLLARNWRFGHLELDLVCEKTGTIIFVEVKTRKNSSFGGAILAVTPKKMQNLSKAAMAWLCDAGRWHQPCRFDIICITGSLASPFLEHYQNAFNCSGSLGCSDSSW